MKNKFFVFNLFILIIYLVLILIEYYFYNSLLFLLGLVTFGIIYIVLVLWFIYRYNKNKEVIRHLFEIIETIIFVLIVLACELQLLIFPENNTLRMILITIGIIYIIILIILFYRKRK